MTNEHVIDAARVHHLWDSSLEPTLVIESGDTVLFDLAMAGRGQVHEGDSVEDTSFDFDTLYNLLGPIWIDGAHAGDTLEVEVLSLKPGAWGWTAILPELGLLPDDFPNSYLRTFDLRSGSRARIAENVSVPLSPFLGTMGVHPGEPATAPPFPPHRGGGNIDNRHLVAGATVRLPIWSRGGLFSCGDPHAAQGDGEVCVSAIECDMQAELRFRLAKYRLNVPMYEVPRRDATSIDGYVGTMGIAPDLLEGAKIAVREMISWIETTCGLSREDAYILCSLAGNLVIHEVVDAGIWNVGFTLPHDVIDRTE